MVIVADHAGDLPAFIRLLPERHVPGRAARSGAVLVLPSVAEAMDSSGDRAVALERIDLETLRHQIAVNLAADVLPDRVNQALPSPAQARLIVIELQIFSKYVARRSRSQVL